MRLLACIATLATLIAVAPEPVRAQSNAVPQGSFSQTCAASYVLSGRLFSSCRNTSGAFVRSSIPLASCTSGDVANINGMLTCGATTGRPEGVTTPRPSTPAVSVTVYSNRGFSGQQRTFTGAQSNLTGTVFYNQISSMRLVGGWQACDQPNYRGRCQSFAGTVSDLSDVDFDNVIASLRPLR